MPANWTDVGPIDSFVVQSQGRAIARVADLLELVKMTAGDVKGIRPEGVVNEPREPRVPLRKETQTDISS